MAGMVADADRTDHEDAAALQSPAIILRTVFRPTWATALADGNESSRPPMNSQLNTSAEVAWTRKVRLLRCNESSVGRRDSQWWV